MTEKKISVWITAKNSVSKVLRDVTKDVSRWSGDVAKIAGGITLFKGVQDLGRFIRASVMAAADAYPQLGAGLKGLGDSFREFKVQAGAGLLEVIQPVIPIFQDLLGWGGKLVNWLTEELGLAMRGAQIVIVHFAAAWESLPGRVDLALAHILRSIANFVTAGGATFERLFGVKLGDDLVRRLDSVAARLGKSGAQRVGFVSAVAKETIEGIQNEHSTRGPRVHVETDAERKAGEDAERESAQLLARNLARQRQERIEAAGGGNSLTGGPRASQGGNALVDAANAAQGATGILAGATDEMRKQAAAAEAAAVANKTLAESFLEVQSKTLLVGEAIGAINGSLLASIPGFGAVAKAATKAIGIVAKIEGGIAIAQGAVKLAKSIFPFNPAEAASGLKMIQTGRQLTSLGGGGGGAASTGGGGSASSSGYGRSQSELAAARAKPRVIILRKGYVRTDDPDFQDFIRDLTTAGDDRS